VKAAHGDADAMQTGRNRPGTPRSIERRRAAQVPRVVNPATVRRAIATDRAAALGRDAL